MAVLWFMFIFLCGGLFVNSEVQPQDAAPTPLAYASETEAVLHHLNATPFKVYVYKQASLVNAHKKADITELALDVSVDCVNNYPDVPCTETVLLCNAFVRNTPGEGSQVLNDVNCKPKPVIIVEEVFETSTLPTGEGDEPKSVALSNEAVSSEVGEHFVAIKKDAVPCLGCPFDLNPNAEGVEELVNLALRHIETERSNKQALVKVLKLQQQVVAGVKYTLVAEIAPTVCAKDSNLGSDSCPKDSEAAPSVCQITYLHKPWISKDKHVIGNNCTVSQEFVKSDLKKPDISNEIDGNEKRTRPPSVPNFDRIAETGTIEEMAPSRLSDLESQILAESDEGARPRVQLSKQTVEEVAVPSTVESRIQLESYPGKREFEATTINEETVATTARTEEETERTKRDESSEESKNTSEENKSEEKDSSEEEKPRAKRSESKESLESKASNSSEESSHEQLRPRRAIRQLEKISPEEKGLVKNLADFAAAALDNIDDDNQKRIILQILGAKKMVGDDGVYYHLIMRMGVSRCLEDRPPNPYENCREKLFENYTKICKVQVYVNDDFGSPKVVKSQCQNIKRENNDSNRTNYSRFRREIMTGGIHGVDKDSDEIKALASAGIAQFNALSGNSKKHKPVEIVSASSQVVAGVLYRIQVKVSETDCGKNDAKDLSDCNVLPGAVPKVCAVKVWEKAWENFRKFTVTCDGDKQTYDAVTTINRRKRRVRRMARLLKGGPKPMDTSSEETKSLALAGIIQFNTLSDNTNKHKPVEVLSATRQVVAGTLYNIRLTVSETDCLKNDPKDLDGCNVLGIAAPKTCDVEIWDKAGENVRKFTIKCDGDAKSYESETNLDVKSRFRRQGLVGGQSQVDKDSDEIKSIARAGITQFNTVSSGNKKHKPVEVLSATQQVVAGILYRIRVKISETDCLKNDAKDLDDCNVPASASPKACELKVWDKSWENFRQFTITCDGEQTHEIVTKLKRAKRSAPDEHSDEHFSEHLVGGQSQVDKNSDEIKSLARAGITQFNTVSSGNKKHKPVEVLSATQQVVAGILYRIRVKISETDCLKNDAKDLDDCNVPASASPKVCELKVWDKSWENFRQFTITCDGDRTHEIVTKLKRTKRGIPGGEFDVPKDDEYVLDYLDGSLRHLDAQSSHSNKLKVHEVVSVSKQVVAGFIYRIKAKIVLTDCKKTDATQRTQCGRLKGAEPKTCDFKIFEQLWVPNSRETNVTCGDEAHSFRAKRAAPKAHFDLFKDFVRKYGKKYSQKEAKHRFNVFSANMERVRLLNDYEQGSATYGVTQFADLTGAEFAKFLGLRPELRNENEPPFARAEIPDVEVPTEFDWRQKGAVTGVKNQEQCGSCWAFSVTGNVEGQYAIKHGSLLEFSEQELVDCDTEDKGCDGGLMDTAYRQIEKLGGLETEQDYPYDAEDEKCHFNRSLARVQLTGAVNISQNEADMAKWLVANGPISIAINANAMQFYMGGVSHPFKFLCSPKSLDHGVLIVGFGIDKYPLFHKDLPYWTVKNSWGTSWGEQGYYRVYRGDGTCGLNQTPSSAIVA